VRNIVVAMTLVLVVGSVAAIADEQQEPCASEMAGTALAINLQDISLTTSSLRLLNGKEDPKLRRLLEWRLATAIAEAKLHVDRAPSVWAPAMPSLVRGVDAAILYFEQHPEAARALQRQHERERNTPDAERSIGTPEANLLYIKEWVDKQPWGRPANPPSPN